MRVFLGVTGASGAPYAARLLQSLAAAGCEVGLCASSAGIEVLATELYGDPALPRDEVLERFVGDAGGQVTVYGIDDYSSPYASGSARVDAYVVCPCSMSTVGTLATGAMANLIHRAASVALKERRKLVLVPRETPLSSIHLRGLATLHEAGAVILLAAPGFYHGAKTIDDLVDFVVARVPRPDRDRQHADAALGGRMTHEIGNARARGRPPDVRPDRSGLRRHEPRHDDGPRPEVAAAHGRGGRPARRARARRLLRHGRPRRRRGAGGRHRHRPRLLRRDARPGAAQVGHDRVGARAMPWRCRSRTGASTPPRSASASATSPTSRRGCGSCAACCVPAAGSRSSRSRSRAVR